MEAIIAEYSKPIWKKPKLIEYKHRLSKELDNYYFEYIGSREWGNEGHGDPELGFECFDDFTYSPELRTKMREQVSIAHDLMPEIDEVVVSGGAKRKREK